VGSSRELCLSRRATCFYRTYAEGVKERRAADGFLYVRLAILPCSQSTSSTYGPQARPAPIPWATRSAFLYFHAVELALKAFLRSQNVRLAGTRLHTHKLAALYEEYRKLGLKIGVDDRFGIANIVSLLESGNDRQAFRYFNPESTVTADLAWTREVVDELMRSIEPYVKANGDSIPGPAVKGILVFGKLF
jgi:hypothetical protein